MLLGEPHLLSTIEYRRRRIIPKHRPQVIRVPRHYLNQPLRSQNVYRSGNIDPVNHRVISLPNNFASIHQTLRNPNTNVQSISCMTFNNNRINELKQRSNTKAIPSVNKQTKSLYFPSNLQFGQFKHEDLNNHSTNVYQNSFLHNITLIEQWTDRIDNPHHKNSNKRRGFCKAFCACSPLCLLLSLVTLISLGTIITAIALGLLITNKTTVTTTMISLSSTTTSSSTTTTDVPCVPTCDVGQSCINGICINVGYLACMLTWSRSGDGDIVVTTATNKTIYYQNRGPSLNTDGGELDRDDQVNKGPENVYWSSNGTVPPTGTYYVCFEPYSINPVIDPNNPLTVIYTILVPQGILHVFTKTYDSVVKNGYNCTSTSPTLMGSFTYP